MRSTREGGQGAKQASLNCCHKKIFQTEKRRSQRSSSFLSKQMAEIKSIKVSCVRERLAFEIVRHILDPMYHKLKPTNCVYLNTFRCISLMSNLVFICWLNYVGIRPEMLLLLFLCVFVVILCREREAATFKKRKKTV